MHILAAHLLVAAKAAAGAMLTNAMQLDAAAAGAE
jgi:hypothetical protein